MKGLKMRSVLMMAGVVFGLAALTAAADDKKEGEGSGDKEFAKKASACGMAEVNLSELAARLGRAPAVKQFAQRAIADHMAANQELVRIANQKSIALAKSMDEKHQKLFEKLQKLDGKEFDREYIEAMVKDHEEAVKLLEAESKDGKDRAMKQWAEKQCPIVKKHLETARKVCDQVKEGKQKE